MASKISLKTYEQMTLAERIKYCIQLVHAFNSGFASDRYISDSIYRHTLRADLEHFFDIAIYHIISKYQLYFPENIIQWRKNCTHIIEKTSQNNLLYLNDGLASMIISEITISGEEPKNFAISYRVTDIHSFTVDVRYFDDNYILTDIKNFITYYKNFYNDEISGILKRLFPLVQILKEFEQYTNKIQI